MQDLIPGVYSKDIVDEIFEVSDEDSYKVAKEFATKEGVLIGISSGAALYAGIEIAKKLGRDKKIVVISPDGGEKYFSSGLYD